MKPNFESQNMENFVKKVCRRKLKSLLHEEAWPQYNYNQHANSPRGENFYVGSKRKSKNLRNLREHSQILSKPRSSRNVNFNHASPRIPPHRIYNTARGELEDEEPFMLYRPVRRLRIPRDDFELFQTVSEPEIPEIPPRRGSLQWWLSFIYAYFERINDDLAEIVGRS